MAKYMVSENEIRRPDTPLGRAKKCQTLDRGLDEDDIAVLFGCSVQTVRATLSFSMPPRPSGKRWSPAQLPLPRRVSWHRLNPKNSGKRWQKSKRRPLALTGHEKARRQRQILGEAKPRLKTRKEITKALEGASGEYADALRWVLGEAV
jgi:ParB family chromosome partitioning protein